MIKKILKIVGVIFVLVITGGILFLYPRENTPEPPSHALIEPFSEIEVNYVHNWPGEGCFPFLGAAVIDIDGNGSLEIFIGGSMGQPDALMSYENQKLIDIIANTGLSSPIATYGAISIDMNDDGATDLIVARHDGVYLYTNHGGSFSSEKIPLSLQKEAVPLSVAVSDIDNDGDGDLYISVFVDVTSFRSATFNDPDHAKRNILLRNDGDQFTDITEASGTASLQNTFLSVFVDINNDQMEDLVVAQNTGYVEIFKNLGNGTFASIPTNTGNGFWMSLAVADIDNDGDQDLFFSNAGNTLPAFLLRGDLKDEERLEVNWALLRNEGDFSFSEVGEEYGLRNFGFAWGAVFEDLNLDGKQDLLVAQNYIQLPNFKLKKLPGKALVQAEEGGQEKLFHADAWGLNNPHFGSAPIIADLNNDGKPDVIWLNMNGPVRAFLNESEANFIAIGLPDKVSSLGTRVSVLADDKQSYSRYFSNAVGFLTDQSHEMVFGLGSYTGSVTAVILDRNGNKTIIENLKVNQKISLN